MKLYIILSLLIVSTAFPQIKWEPMTGFPYRTIFHLCVNSTGDIFAGTSGASGMAILKKSPDSTYFKTSWATSNYVSYLYWHRSSGNIIAGSNYGLIYSSDNGASWKRSNITFGPASCIAENSFGELFAQVSGGLNHSIDGGKTWIQKGSSGNVVSPEVNGKMYAVGDSYLTRSTDHGNLWVGINNLGSDFSATSIYVEDDGLMYISSSNKGVSRSTNGGYTFEDVTEGLFTNIVYSVTGIKGVGVFVSTPYGIWKSTNRGSTWSQVLGDGDRNFLSIVKDGENGLYAASRYGGIYYSPDYGVTWTARAAGLPAYEADKYTAHPSGWMFASFPYFGVMGSSNNGVNWVNRTNGLFPSNSYTSRGVSSASSGTLFVSCDDKLYRSQDLGLNWYSTPAGNLPRDFEHIIELSGGLLFGISNARGIFKSTNDGVSWSAAYSTASIGYDGLILSQDSIIYFATKTNVVRSHDRGVSWKEGAQTIPLVNEIATSPEGTIFAICYNKPGVYVSTDRGDKWVIKGASTLLKPYHLVRTADGRLISGSATDGAFSSTDGGETWQNISYGLIDTRISRLYITPFGEIWASTVSGGTHKLTGITSIQDEDLAGLPAGFSLSQNYPNPFNPETVIRFSLPEAGFVKGVVYDILGREVATLLKSDMTAGNHQVKFDATGIASGVYVFRLEAGKYSSAIKMVVGK